MFMEIRRTSLTTVLHRAWMNRWGFCERVTDLQRIRPEKSEVFRLWGDNTLIRELTNFNPKYTLEAGLAETINWFLIPENLKTTKTEIYNL
jgi:nucleoside-diphosphate-sugar epimerase